MGISTKALLTKEGLTPFDVMSCLNDVFYTRQVHIAPTTVWNDGSVYINFTYMNEERTLKCSTGKFWEGVCFYGDGCLGDYEHITTKPCLYLSFGCWGFSERIMMHLLKELGGGWYVGNDSVDDWTKVIVA